MNKQTEISADQLRLLIIEEGKKLHEMLTRKRKELGNRYNQKNEFELMYQKFGDPRVNPDIFYSEYGMIVMCMPMRNPIVIQTIHEPRSRNGRRTWLAG